VYLTSGDRIYVEPNIFLFDARANARFGHASLEFLKRGSQAEFKLFTSSLTIDEIAFVALKVKLEGSGAIAPNAPTLLATPHGGRRLGRTELLVGKYLFHFVR